MSLPPETVRLYLADLDDADWDQFAYTLNESERQRGARFRTEQLRAHFRRARAFLRSVCARQLAIAPESLTIESEVHGKPYVPGHPLHFNLSHSGRYALLGISHDEIGVDIEYHQRREIELDGLLAMICHVSEHEHVLSLDDAARHQAFFRWWTRKEAYCKLVGLGLHIDLKQIRFVGQDAQQAGLDVPAAIVADEANDQRAYVRDISGPPGYAAAVCLRRPVPMLEWSEVLPCSVMGKAGETAGVISD